MKRSIWYLWLIFGCLTACNSSTQKEAEKLKDQIQKNTSGEAGSGSCSESTVATASGGYTMSAKFNGKQWTATCMYDPYEVSSIVGQLYGTGSEGVGLPFPNKGDGWEVGYVKEFEKGSGADLFYDDDIGIYGGSSGKMTVTKIDDQWIEGTFSFTGTSTSHPSAKIEVTDGFFRIPAHAK